MKYIQPNNLQIIKRWIMKYIQPNMTEEGKDRNVLKEQGMVRTTRMGQSRRDKHIYIYICGFKRR